MGSTLLLRSISCSFLLPCEATFDHMLFLTPPFFHSFVSFGSLCPTAEHLQARVLQYQLCAPGPEPDTLTSPLTTHLLMPFWAKYIGVWLSRCLPSLHSRTLALYLGPRRCSVPVLLVQSLVRMTSFRPSCKDETVSEDSLASPLSSVTPQPLSY